VEFFALIMLGLSLLMGLAGTSMIKALMMGMFGLLLAMIGWTRKGLASFHLRPYRILGRYCLRSGNHGLFGLSEILANAEKHFKDVFVTKIGSLIPPGKILRIP